MRISAEAPLPQPVGEDYGLRPVPLAFLFRKTAAKLRLNTQECEEVLRYAHTHQPLRVSRADQVVRPVIEKREVCGQIFEGPVRAAPFEISGNSRCNTREPAVPG